MRRACSTAHSSPIWFVPLEAPPQSLLLPVQDAGDAEPPLCSAHAHPIGPLGLARALPSVETVTAACVSVSICCFQSTMPAGICLFSVMCYSTRLRQLRIRGIPLHQPGEGITRMTACSGYICVIISCDGLAVRRCSSAKHTCFLIFHYMKISDSPSG